MSARAVAAGENIVLRPVDTVEGKSLQNTQEGKHAATSWAPDARTSAVRSVIDTPNDSPAC